MKTATAPEVATESWRITWRDGFAPLIPTEVLESLATALRDDDQRLTQGSTTTPPPLIYMQDFPVEAGCLLGYCGAVANGGFGVATVGQTEEWFARACFDADMRLGEPAACRWTLNHYGDCPRDEMRAIYLAEVERELSRRATGTSVENVDAARE